MVKTGSMRKQKLKAKQRLKLDVDVKLQPLFGGAKTYFSPPFKPYFYINFDYKVATMLYLVGLGLSDETDITVKGLAVVKQASRVYLEAYTSILLVDKAVLVSQ